MQRSSVLLRALSRSLGEALEARGSVPSTSFSSRLAAGGPRAPQPHAWRDGQYQGRSMGRSFAAQPHASENSTSTCASSGASRDASQVIDCAPSPGTAKPCWSCGSASDPATFSFFCKECSVIQPKRSDADHYAVMGLPTRSFDLDPSDLEARYKNLQRLLHPDKFTTKSEEERAYSDDQASLVNVAYHTLREPLRRANYLLNGTGIGCGEGFEGTIADPELLMEVMERREEIESTEDRAKLQGLRATLEMERKGVVGDLSGAFKARDFEAAGSLMTRLRYLQRMDEQILDKL